MTYDRNTKNTTKPQQDTTRPQPKADPAFGVRVPASRPASSADWAAFMQRSAEYDARFGVKGNAFPAGATATTATPARPSAKPTDTPWERRYIGKHQGITFHLRLRRLRDGTLSARYMVEGGAGHGWHLHGTLMQDGTFTLKGTENNATFRGAVAADGFLQIHEFHGGKVTLKNFHLAPEGGRKPLGSTPESKETEAREPQSTAAPTKPEAPAPTTPGPSQPVTPTQPQQGTTPSAENAASPKQPKANGQAWANPKSFVGTGVGNAAIRFTLTRDKQGIMRGTYSVNGNKEYTVTGTLYKDDTVELAAENGARLIASLSFNGQAYTLKGRFERATYKSDLVMGQVSSSIKPPVASDAGEASNSDGMRSSWEDTISDNQRSKLPALTNTIFLKELDRMCERLGLQRDIVLAVMNFESKGLNPKQASTANNKHFGLIQIGPAALIDINKYIVSNKLPLRIINQPSDIANLSATEQLPYVEIYFKQHGLGNKDTNKKAGLEEVYMSVLGGHAKYAKSPIWLSRAEDPETYEQNWGLDSNEDGKITPQEAADLVRVRWREAFGNNLDERSTRLSSDWAKRGSRRIEKVVYNAKPVDKRPINSVKSAAATNNANEVSNSGGSKTSKTDKASFYQLTSQQKKSLRAGGNRSWGKVIGQFNGIEAYYNEFTSNEKWKRNKAEDGYDFGYKWQCVEYIRRYFYKIHGHRFNSKGHAFSYFNANLPDGGMNSERGLRQYKNASREKPKAGDLIVMGPFPFSDVGHVAIVAFSYDEEIKIVQQNVVENFSEIFKMKKIGSGDGARWKVNDPYGAVLGWLRKE